MGRLRDDLAGPEVERVEETHISWVFLTRDRAFKVKKPLDLGFLDFTTPEKRRAACEAEVRLNRRLAPDVYRGVLPVTRGPDGRHRLGGEGPPVDWAVEMRRLPDDWRADVRLRAGRLDAGDLERVAGRVAAFHAAARCDAETSRFGEVDVVGGNVRENFEQTRGAVEAFLTPAQARELEAWQTDFLRREADRFGARVAAGRVRDGHGDLRLEHVYLDPAGAVLVVDCIEFNERFRYGDVCADVAFLSMDLTAAGRADLAERFVAAYARESGDYDLYPLIDFYESYRAYVRAKVRTMLAADPEASPRAREAAAAEARRYFLLALASERRSPLPPMVVAVGGVIASGKSTVAERLAAEMAAPVIESDRTRKQMLGVRPTEHVREGAWQGAYHPDFTREVYAEMLRRAGAVLTSGRSVVLDASYRAPEMRAAARRLARDHGAGFLFVECRADRETLRARLERRAAVETVSDARADLLDDFLARWQPADELPPDERLVADTTRPVEETLAALRARVPTWPAGLTA